MKFILYNDLLTNTGKPITWVEAGEYSVIRLFGNHKAIIDLGISPNGNRKITVVPLYKGQLIREEGDGTYSTAEAGSN